MLELNDERRRSLTQLVSAWVARRPGAGETGDHRWVEVREVEVLRPGRPGLLDVIAEVDGRLAHMVLGVRRPGQEAHFLRAVDEPVLGLFEDEVGLGVVLDALHDAELAPELLAAVTGEGSAATGVAPVADGDDGTVLAFTDRCLFTVFPWLTDGSNPGVELLVALDEAGFNHLAAPLARWRRGGRDLGLVQELLAGSAGGWALALTSLRDLYASGGAPEEAGGDFGPEARSLGTMTARMHLALDRAFGRRNAEVAALVAGIQATVAGADPRRLDDREVHEALASLRVGGLRCPTIVTHGDFHLGRAARTDPGWVVADTMPGGVPPGASERVFRSPLADVADLLWSLHHVATVAASERDPTGRSGLAALARAWESRNRRAFLSGYLGTPGIGGLVPGDREVVRNLAAAFELERGARRADGRPG
jgi:maltokinase